jgi:hypothetical protein
MTDEELLKITNSIEEKLGKENSAVIADDIGLLMTGNAKAQENLQNLQGQVNDLKAKNEKLVLANGNLLKQVPQESETSVNNRPKGETNSEESHINLSDAFDKSGRFVR